MPAIVSVAPPRVTLAVGSALLSEPICWLLPLRSKNAAAGNRHRRTGGERPLGVVADAEPLVIQILLDKLALGGRQRGVESDDLADVARPVQTRAAVEPGAEQGLADVEVAGDARCRRGVGGVAGAADAAADEEAAAGRAPHGVGQVGAARGCRGPLARVVSLDPDARAGTVRLQDGVRRAGPVLHAGGGERDDAGITARRAVGLHDHEVAQGVRCVRIGGVLQVVAAAVKGDGRMTVDAGRQNRGGPDEGNAVVRPGNHAAGGRGVGGVQVERQPWNRRQN